MAVWQTLSLLFIAEAWSLQVSEVNDGQHHSDSDVQEGRTSPRDSRQQG